MPDISSHLSATFHLGAGQLKTIRDIAYNRAGPDQGIQDNEDKVCAIAEIIEIAQAQAFELGRVWGRHEANYGRRQDD